MHAYITLYICINVCLYSKACIVNRLDLVKAASTYYIAKTNFEFSLHHIVEAYLVQIYTIETEKYDADKR